MALALARAYWPAARDLVKYLESTGPVGLAQVLQSGTMVRSHSPRLPRFRLPPKWCYHSIVDVCAALTQWLNHQIVSGAQTGADRAGLIGRLKTASRMADGVEEGG